MAPRQVKLSVIVDARADGCERDSAAQAVVDELRDTGTAFEIVPVSHGTDGAKGPEHLILNGQVVLALLASGGVLTSLIASVQGWLQRNQGKEVEIQIGTDKLRLKGVSDEERKQLIAAFVKRHAG